jgi:hypothetical protein
VKNHLHDFFLAPDMKLKGFRELHFFLWVITSSISFFCCGIWMSLENSSNQVWPYEFSYQDKNPDSPLKNIVIIEESRP